MAFASEKTKAPHDRVRPPQQGRVPTWPMFLGLSALAGVIVAAGGFGGLQLVRARTQRLGVETRPAKLTVTSHPAGTEVLLDGQPKGATPLALTVQAGNHSLALRRNGTERIVPVTVAAGSEIAQHIEMPADDSTVLGGRLTIVTDPPGARVTVDGQPRGVSPVTLGNLAATKHKIVVASGAGTAERSVSVERGALTSVVFALPRSSPPAGGTSGGWVSLSAPFDVQLLEGSEVVGSNASAKIMLTAGRHDVILVNRSLGYRETRRIDVVAGKVATVRIEAPKAVVSVNARPWADIFVDAKAVGQTPLANLVVPIGTHHVLFRHPTWGERQQSIVVTAGGPNRVAIDLTR